MLLSTTVPFYVTHKSRDGLLHTTLKPNTTNSSLFIHYQEFDHVILENIVLPTKTQITTNIQHMTFTSEEEFTDKAVNASLLKFSKLVQQLDDIKTTNANLKMEDIHQYISIVPIFLLISLIIIVLLFIRFYWLKAMDRMQKLENRIATMRCVESEQQQ
jgi:hypothetical protein